MLRESGVELSLVTEGERVTKLIRTHFHDHFLMSDGVLFTRSRPPPGGLQLWSGSPFLPISVDCKGPKEAKIS
ncbi:hypothetical protein BGW80DRAFT_1290896 [Lactifluus volemus]|nr:hypothetical protein BGW80DRAFT_1290896 [Lactifluus volemus]